MSQQIRDVVRGRDGFYRVRRESLDPMDASSRRPPAIVTQRVPATEPKRPIITKEAPGPSSPRSAHGGAQLEASFIMPASSGRHHHRHSSVTTNDRLSAKDRDRERERERLYPGSRGPTGSRSSTRYASDGRDYSYEYTTPKEQVLRDLAPPQPRVRSSSHSGGRPVSMINLDYRDRGYMKTDRDMPPPTSRVLDDVNRKASLKQGSRDDSLTPSSAISARYPRDDRESTKYRDLARSHAASRNDYVAYPPEQARHSRQRQPTIEVEPPSRHQSIATEPDGRDGNRPHRHHRHREPDDPKYADSRPDRHRRHDYDEGETRSKRRDAIENDYHDRRREVDEQSERRPRKDIDIDEGKERRRRYSDRYEDERDRRYEMRERDRHRTDQGEDHSASGFATAGGAAAVAGLAAEGVRRHHHRDEDERALKPSHTHRQEADRQRDGPDTDLSEGEEREERRRRRRREREIEELSSRYDTDERQPLRIEDGPSSEHTLREQQSYERHPEGSRETQRRRRKHRHRHRSPSESNERRDDLTDSFDSEDSADPVTRTPRVVSPPNDNAEMAPRQPPKGILKKPRDKFPEEEHTVREGVAPLDAAKKGIPSEARWTRINRRLVNPEALEQEGIRFEEFPDYVIVLKVLSPEEISRFTKVTHEIRERRRLEHGSQGSVSGSGSVGQGEERPSSPENPRN